MRYVRIYADQDGESHFEDVSVKFYAVNLLPPAPPVNLAGFQGAKQVSFLREEPGWHGAPHTAPSPSLYFLLEGELEITASDGETRRLGPGAILRTDDVTGKGHATRVVGDNAALLGVVQLDG